jgi:hypothetical protein
METMALLGALSAAPPVGADKVTVKDLFPENGVTLLTDTEKVLADSSPVDQFKVPLAAVKSLPATAVPFFVAYDTAIAPLDPPTRLTVTLTELPF